MNTDDQSSHGAYSSLPDADIIGLLFTGGERLPREFALEAISRGERLIPALAEILKTEKNWTSDSQDYWAVIHASYLLGAIGGEKAVEPLVAALLYGIRHDNDWVTEELPSIFGQLGPCAVVPLKRLGTNPDLGWDPRSSALCGLATLTLRNPEYDGEIFSLIAGIAAGAEEDLDTRASAALILMDFQRAECKGIILSTLAATKELGVYDETEVARAFSGDRDLYWYTRDWLDFYSPEKLAERDKDWKEEGINWEPDDADIFDENECPLISRKAALKYLGVNTPLAVITRETLNLIRRGLFQGGLKEEYALAMDIYHAITALYDESEDPPKNSLKSGKTASEYSDFSPESAKADAARLAPFTLFDIAVGRNHLLDWLIPLPGKLCDAGMAREGAELAAAWAELAEPDIFLGDKAFLLAEAGFGDEARAQIKHNLKIFEEDAWIHIKAGFALEILNDLSAAEVLYRKALELAEDEEESDDAFECLIPLLRRLGKTAEAAALEAEWEREPAHETPPWPETVKLDGPKIGRNEPCPCGSGKKHKRCCLNKDGHMADFAGGQHMETDIFRQYLSKSNEIIGVRTADQTKYDNEVVRWLDKGKSIRKAIDKANEKFPTEALTLNDGNLAAVQAHYDYLAKHESIMRKLRENTH